MAARRQPPRAAKSPYWRITFLDDRSGRVKWTDPDRYEHENADKQAMRYRRELGCKTRPGRGDLQPSSCGIFVVVHRESDSPVLRAKRLIRRAAKLANVGSRRGR